MHVAILGDRNVIKKEAESILRMKKDIAMEIQRMCNVKTNVIIIAATGTISKLLRKYLNYKWGMQEIREVQKTATLGTAHILRKVLM
jgi:hypothetical protein